MQWGYSTFAGRARRDKVELVCKNKLIFFLFGASGIDILFYLVSLEDDQDSVKEARRSPVDCLSLNPYCQLDIRLWADGCLRIFQFRFDLKLQKQEVKAVVW